MLFLVSNVAFAVEESIIAALLIECFSGIFFLWNCWPNVLIDCFAFITL